jgi:predicted phage terminase large subunit-like protein
MAATPKMRRRPVLTELRFDQKVAALSAWAATAVSPFRDRSRAEQVARKARAATDYQYFVQTYLPHYFDCEPAPFHREVVELAHRRPNLAAGEVVVPTVVAAPRGFAKSTVLAFAYTLWEALFERRVFAIIGSETKDLAESHVASVAAECTENPRVIYDFAPAVIRCKAGLLTLGNGFAAIARGAGQQVRGLKHRAKRPDLCILDDLENDESARNPERVKKLLKWIKSTVYFALDPGATFIIIGTIISKKSALAVMLLSIEDPYPNWTRRLYRAIQDDGTSLWPAKYSVAVLEGQRRSMGEAAFRQEKQNDPPDDDDFFRLEWIRQYQPEELPPGLAVASYYDPATGAGDFGAVVTVGLESATMTFYVLDAWIKKAGVAEALKASLVRHQLYGFLRWGIETNGFQSLCLHLLPELEAEAGTVLPVVQITHSGAKSLRIESLSPLCERSKLVFWLEQGDQRLLVQQLLSYPRGHDDGPDALEGAVRLLMQGKTTSAGVVSVPGRR